MKINSFKPKLNWSKKVRVLLFTAFLSVILLVFISSQTKFVPYITEAITILLPNKFCDDPSNSKQTGCTGGFIRSVMALGNSPYQDVQGNVNITGKLGLGTINPQSTVDISGTYNVLRIITDNTGTTATNYIRGQSNNLVLNANGTLYLNYPENNAGMTRIGETLFVERTGKVGVKRNAPTSTLEVGGDMGQAGNRNVKVWYPNGGTLNGTEFSALTNLQSTDWPGGTGGATGWTALFANTGAVASPPYPYAGVFRGKVVIGGDILSAGERNFKVHYPPGGGLLNTEFSALTHLNNEAGVTAWTAMYAKAGSATYAGVFNGDVRITGTAWVTSGAWTGSDSRFKKDIEKISNPLSKLKMLEGITFNWRKEQFPQMNFTDGRQYGLIAQDVEKVIPELVTTDAQGYKSVAYDKLTVVLLEAVKSQQKEIENLQNQIKELLEK